MAETSGVRKGIKLRIKLPGKAQPASHPPALPQQGPSSKPSAVPSPPPALVHARRCKKRRLLDGYVPPDAQPSAIVDCLRKGEQFSPLQLVPPWDLSLALPACLRGSEGSRSKRGRTQEGTCAALRDSQQRPAAEAAAPLLQGLPASEPAQPCTLLPQQQPQQSTQQHSAAEKLHEQAQVKAQEPPRAPQAAQLQEDPSGTSSSDNTTSIALGPGAPSNHSPPLAAAGASCSPETALRDSTTSHPHLASSTADAAHAFTQQHPEQLQGVQHHDQQQPLPSARRTAACSTQACLGPVGSSSILPSSLMQIRYARMGDVTTRDLRMPLPRQQHRSSQQRQHQHLTDKTVEGLLAAAQSQKREVDARRGTEGLSVLHVAAYTQSALKFMEACEAMVKLPRTPERLASIGRLYVQTSDLLNFTVRVADSVRDTSCARDALGVLCKRLSAVCLAREAALLPHRMTEYANRVQQLLHRSSIVASQPAGPALSQSAPSVQATRSTGTHAAPTTTTTNAKGQPQHPSPDDSTTSSQDQIALSQPQHPHHNHHNHPAASAGRPPPSSTRPAHHQHHPHAQHQHQHSSQQALLPADMRAKLLVCARQMVRGGEQLKRTMHGFQALTERADVQQSRTARLACIHIAAVSMDYGLAEQGHARAHALQAIQHIREISNGS